MCANRLLCYLSGVVLGIFRQVPVEARGYVAFSCYPLLDYCSQTSARGRGRTSITYVEALATITGSDADSVNFFPWAPNRYEPALFEGAFSIVYQRRILRGFCCDVYFLGERVTRQHGRGLPAMVPLNPPEDMISLEVGSPSWVIGREGTSYDQLSFGGDYDLFVRAHLRTPQVLRAEGISTLPLPSSRVAFMQGDQSMLFDIPIADTLPRRIRPPPGARV